MMDGVVVLTSSTMCITTARTVDEPNEIAKNIVEETVDVSSSACIWGVLRLSSGEND